MEYKGYDISIEFDADYPKPLNWRVSIYENTPEEYKCKHIDYVSSRNEGEKKAKEYIDAWIESNE